MLKLLTQKNIKENWEKYKPYIEKAFTSSEGSSLITSSNITNIYKTIYGRLMNPFNKDIHLWTEDEEIYLLLTEIQECEFTGRKTIILSSSTRMKDVDEETRSKWYYDSYMVISKFARERKCVGMYCYSELDYFAEMARKTKKWSNVITRYQFYFPL